VRTTTINALLASNLLGPLTAENLGAAKDSLVNAIAATYPDAPDKLQAFIDALASHMGEPYPLKTYKSHKKVSGSERKTETKTLG
jgi:hypothetical protein